MWTRKFWKDAVERAIKSFAQTAVVLVGSDLVSIVDLDGGYIVGASVTMALVSVLTSIGSAPVGPVESASLTVATGDPKH